MPKFPRRKEVSVLDPPSSSFRDRLMAQGRPSENVTTPRHRYYWWDRYNPIEKAVVAVETGLRSLGFHSEPGLFGFTDKMDRAAAEDRARLQWQNEVEERANKNRAMPSVSRPHVHSEPIDDAGILAWIFFSQAMQQSERR